MMWTLIIYIVSSTTPCHLVLYSMLSSAPLHPVYSTTRCHLLLYSMLSNAPLHPVYSTTRCNLLHQFNSIQFKLLSRLFSVKRILMRDKIHIHILWNEKVCDQANRPYCLLLQSMSSTPPFHVVYSSNPCQSPIHVIHIAVFVFIT